MKKIISLLFIVVCFTSCDVLWTHKGEQHFYISVANNAEYPIYLGHFDSYDNLITAHKANETILQHSTKEYYCFKFSAEIDLRGGKDTLIIGCFTSLEDTASIRYDLSLYDLQHLNWAVPYPPDERMKNMKMYPPYDTNE